MFQPAIFIFQSFQSLCLVHFQATLLASPGLDGGFTDAVLACQIRHFAACFVLFQDADDLLFAESAFLHLRILLLRSCAEAEILNSTWSSLSSAGQSGR